MQPMFFTNVKEHDLTFSWPQKLFASIYFAWESIFSIVQNNVINIREDNFSYSTRLTCCSSLLRPYRGYDTTDIYNYSYFFWIGARIFAQEKKETNRNYFKSIWKFNISTLRLARRKKRFSRLETNRSNGKLVSWNRLVSSLAFLDASKKVKHDVSFNKRPVCRDGDPSNSSFNPVHSRNSSSPRELPSCRLHVFPSSNFYFTGVVGLHLNFNLIISLRISWQNFLGNYRYHF